MAKFLLTDPQSRKTFDVHNVLAYFVDDLEEVFISKTPFPKLFKLIYKKAEFYRSFSQFLKEGKEAIFIPLEEHSILEVYKYKGALENLLYLLPQEESFWIARDKKKLMLFCEKYGFPIPRTFFSKDEIKKDARFPLLFKKRFGSGARGQIIAKDSYTFSKLIEDLNLDEYIIQEYITNDKEVYGAFFLYKDGELKSWACHRRIRTYPKEGGVSVFSEIFFEESLKESGKKILDRLFWSGLAMLEFVYDRRDKKFKLLEINPRLWGSILLTASLLKDYVELLLGVSFSKDLLKKRYISWVFPGEIVYFLSSKDIFESLRSIGYLLRRRNDILFINFSYTTFLKSILFFNLQVLSKLSKKMGF